MTFFQWHNTANYKMAKFTQSQKEILDAISSGSNIFMTGPGGVGKSFVITRIENATITAMTGAAAVLIGGKTLHSTLGIGIARESSDKLAKKVSRQTWTDLKLLVIDEVSMLSAELLDKIEHITRIVRKNDLPFGGIQLVLSGDFLQLPTIEGDFCFNAKCWNKLNFEYFVLSEIKRQVDVDFQRVLNSARVGKLTDLDINYLLNGGIDVKENEKKGIIPTRILCRNIDVDNINEQELAKLPTTETCTYEMEISLKKEYCNITIRPEFFCSAPKSITLAVGAQVMLIVNKNQDSGLINGSRGVVTRFDDRDVPVVKFTNGIEMSVDFHTWDIADRNKIYGNIHAIPLKLAWAITCHKSQGASIDSVYIDLSGVFEYGQAYVAISRVRSHSSLILKNATKEMFKAHPIALEFYNNI